MKLTKKLEAGIKEFMKTYWDTYLKGDLKKWATFLPADYKNIGGTEEEIWNSKKEILDYSKRMINQMVGQAEIRNTKTQIFSYDPYIMVHEFMDMFIKVDKKWTFYGKFRLSSIIQKTTGGWKVLHQHGSYPDSKTAEGEAFAFDTLKSENIKLLAAVKSRTAELEVKNRELEIESSLEKVRAQALGMKKPEDLTNVCEVLFKELQVLGFAELRNAMVNIHNDEQRTFVNYDYSHEIGKSITPLFYDIHPIIKKQIKKIRSANDAFSETIFKGKDLESWKAFRKSKGEKEDKRIKSSTALYYYFYSIGTGSIGISTFNAIPKEKKEVLKQFRNVFEFAYRRYMDVTQAEAQAREAQIELGLERVRARSLAMHKTSELQAVIHTVHQELLKLNLGIQGGSFIAINADINKELRCWGAGGTADTAEEVHIPFYNKPFYTNIVKRIKKGPGFFTEAYSQQEKKNFFTFLFKHEPWSKLKAKEKKETLASPGGYTRSCSVMKHTSIFIINHFGKIFSEDENEILKRFGKVFEQTFTRFLDLQKAEAQAREAQIELGLERVRARAMAMQTSNELSELVDTVFKELTNLDFALSWCMINIIDEPSLTNTLWSANPDIDEASKSIQMKFEDYPFHHAGLKAYRERQTKFVYVMEGNEKKEYEKYMFTKSEVRKLPPAAKKAMRAMKRYVFTYSFSNFGGLQTVGEEPLSEENLDILARFGKVFDLTYTRFNDLLKAEEQAREAEIELALERVRAKSMAMQKSDELADLSFELVKQVQSLGVPTWFCAFNIYDKDGKGSLEWGSNAEGTYKSYRTLREGIFLRYYKAGQKGETLLINEIGEKECPAHYEYLCSLPGVGEQLLNMKEAGIPFPTSQIDHVAFFKYGYIIFITYEAAKASHEVFKRFAKVFEQTYTRFLDLQKAEAQAREGQIQLALERVRARTMAMQRSDELLETAVVLFDQLNQLGENIERTIIGIINEEENAIDAWITRKDGSQMEMMQQFPLDEPIVMQKIYKGWKQHKKSIVIDLQGKDLEGYFQFLKSRSPRLKRENIGKRRVESFAFFSKGMLGVINADPNAPASVGLYERFAVVFDQTYTRFLDLQRAEAQAREAEIELALERVRARTMAMQKSEELQEVIQIVYNQLSQLKILVEHAGFIIDYKEKDDLHIWLADRHLAPSEVTIPAFDSPPNNSIKEAKDNGRDSFKYLLNFKEKNKFYQELFEFIPDVPQATLDYYFNCPGLAGSGILLENIGLYIENFEGIPYTDEENNTLMRFGKVFQQTYTRFLDLQKAEAQAREAQIEAALERVRSRAMAMHSSHELLEVIEVIAKHLSDLKIKYNNVSFGSNVPSEEIKFWTAAVGLERPMYMEIPAINNPAPVRVWDAQKKGIKFFADIISTEENREWIEHVIKYSDLKSLPDEMKNYMLNSVGFARSTFILKNINLYVGNYRARPYTDDENEIIGRFAQVFEQSYIRFLDLQKAEVQAREAQIEAALERVRSRTMAMQSSDELSETAVVVFRQLIDLGIEPNRLYIGIIKENNGLIEMWATDEDGSKIGSKVIFDTAKNTSVAKIFNAWKKQEKSLNLIMEGQELADYLKYLNEELGISVIKSLSQQKRFQTVSFFSKGFIGIAAPEEQPEETTKLLERFAAVFNLTYTRFNDLKIAEAHAVQAERDLILLQTEKKKAEDALSELKTTQSQLIQSEKMASLGELTAGIAHEIQNPLNFVNNFSEVSNELLDEMLEAANKGDFEEVREILNDVKQNLEKINHHGKRADGIVKGMLQHSRSSSGTKEPTDINALADEYLRLAYHGLRAKDKSFNATMKTDFDESLEKVNVIPQDLGRVILNLITNAFYVVAEKKKQLPEGYEPTVIVSTKKEGTSVLVLVKDNGNGIPPKVLDKIFQPFFTTKPTGQGTGLGLSLAYDIVKAHGGELKVETNEGEGTTFIISLPINHT